jgi:ABC-type nitrate/sulfonate/bicarbonate transport system substrate-binding protein
MTRRGLLAGAGAITLAAPMLAPRLARAATPASFQLDWKINAQFAGLTSLDVLRGKTVGVHVDGVKVMALVKGVTGIDDIELVEIDHANKFDRAVSGEFAAVQCLVIDEPIGVAARTGAEPEVLKLSDQGFVSTAQTIVASEATLAERPDLVRAILAATSDGWTRALTDKPGTAAVIVDRYVEEGSAYKDVAYQTSTLELLEPLRDRYGPHGRHRPVKWREASELMAAYGIVAALPDLEASLAPGFYG